jgi:hypothetical protein
MDLAQKPLVRLEIKMRVLGIKILFKKYEYPGKLIRNSGICGEFESMNLYCKHI